MRSILFTLILSLAAGCAGTTGRADPAQTSRTVIEGATVLTMTGEQALKKQRVIVEDGRITSVEPAIDTAPRDARIIDGDGLYLMPGLADMHAHYLGRQDGILFIANGVTTIRNLAGGAMFIAQDEINKAGVVAGPHIYTAGPIIDGVNAVRPDFSVIATNADEARGAVRANKRSGYRAVKLYETLSADAYKAAADEATKLGMEIYTHTPGSLTIQDVLAAGAKSVEHFDGYGLLLAADGFQASVPRYAELQSWLALDPAKLERAVEISIEADVWNTPTLTLDEDRYAAFAAADAFFAKPESQYLDPGIIGYWRSSTWMQYYVNTAENSTEAKRRFLKALYDAGANLLIGTDTPNPFIIPGFSIHDELENFQEAGIPNDAILNIATREAARFFGEETEFGVVAKGARADLLLLSGDPRTDLSVLRAPVGVMMNGHWYDRKAIDAALDVLSASRNKPVAAE